MSPRPVLVPTMKARWAHPTAVAEVMWVVESLVSLSVMIVTSGRAVSHLPVSSKRSDWGGAVVEVTAMWSKGVELS